MRSAMILRLSAMSVVLLALSAQAESTDKHSCRGGIKLFAFGGHPRTSTLRSPLGKPLPAQRDPALVLLTSDVQDIVRVPASDTHVPEIGTRVATHESVAVLLSDEGTKKFADFVRANRNVAVFYASCDGLVADGTLTYPRNFDDVVARDGRGYVFIADDIDRKSGPSPTP